MGERNDTVIPLPGPLTREEVQERAETFLELYRREAELKDFLVRLKVQGDEESVKEQLRQYQEAMAEIDQNRNERMVPIVKEFNEVLLALAEAAG